MRASWGVSPGDCTHARRACCVLAPPNEAHASCCAHTHTHTRTHAPGMPATSRPSGSPPTAAAHDAVWWRRSAGVRASERCTVVGSLVVGEERALEEGRRRREVMVDAACALRYSAILLGGGALCVGNLWRLRRARQEPNLTVVTNKSGGANNVQPVAPGFRGSYTRHPHPRWLSELPQATHQDATAPDHSAVA
jgi:hypothetical protein